MAVCNPTFSTDSSSISTIPDFERFLENDPSKFFNVVELTTLTSLNNVLLSNISLKDYPNISSRLREGVITNQEFADFIVDVGFDIDYIKNAFIENFPVPIDYNTVRALFDNSTSVATTTSIATGTTGVTVTTGTTGVTGTTGTTGVTGTDASGAGTFNTGTGNDFIIDTGSSISQNPDITPVIIDTGEGVINPNWDPSNEIVAILILQDKYYDNRAFNASVCAALVNPFAKVIDALSALSDLASSLLGVFDSIKGLVNDIKNYGSLSGIIQGLQQKLTSFVNELKDKVLSIANQALAQVTAIADKAASFFNQVAYLPQQVYNFVQKKIEQTKNFFKAENMKNLQDKVQSFFDNMLNQFEDILPNALNYFLLIACGLSNLLQDILNAPVLKLKSVVDSLTNTHDALAGYSSTARNSAVRAGAIRTTPEQRKREAKAGIENNNRAAARRAPAVGTGDTGQWDVPSGRISADISHDELIQLSQLMDSNGYPGALSFDYRVNRMGKRATEKFNGLSDPRSLTKYFPKYGHRYYGDIFDPERNFYDEETGVDAGWKKVQPAIWIKIIRVSRILQQEGHLDAPLLINSAYRSPFYNYFMTGGAEYSNHMEGKALDVTHTRVNDQGGIIYKLGDEGEAAFIRACSEQGFTRIVRYRTFIHIDNDGPRSTTWSTGAVWGKNAQDAWDAHVAGVYQRS